jgi:hypothetical protein
MLTWLVFFFNFASYYAVIVVSLSYSKGIAIFLGVQYFILSAVVLSLAIIATRIDPSDPTIKL